MSPEAPPTANLSTIEFGLLQANDRSERKRVLQACVQQGFFYLDLNQDEDFLADWESVLRFMGEYFAQPVEVKLKDDRKSDTHGYQPVATSAGAVKDLPDFYESLKGSRDEFQLRHGTLAPSLAANYEL